MSDFKWAHSNKANKAEPISALKEDGWRSSEAPTAANFNWLFNKVGDELTATTKLIEKTSGELKEANKLIEQTRNDLVDTSNSIKSDILVSVGRKISPIHDSISRIDSYLQYLSIALTRNHPNQSWPELKL